jgi:hypothetical protein
MGDAPWNVLALTVLETAGHLFPDYAEYRIMPS